ncbi:MAG: UDP-N-acetylmuramate-L-alanine ligase, partial [Parcubacteria group bacterium GW2011_GWF1_43_9]
MSKFNQAKRIYFIGLKGVGMTALAQLLKSRGVQVWGSDTEEQFFTDKVLAAAGIECEIGFSAKHLDRPIDLVIRS